MNQTAPSSLDVNFEPGSVFYDLNGGTHLIVARKSWQRDEQGRTKLTCTPLSDWTNKPSMPYILVKWLERENAYRKTVLTQAVDPRITVTVEQVTAAIKRMKQRIREAI